LGLSIPPGWGGNVSENKRYRELSRKYRCRRVRNNFLSVWGGGGGEKRESCCRRAKVWRQLDLAGFPATEWGVGTKPLKKEPAKLSNRETKQGWEGPSRSGLPQCPKNRRTVGFKSCGVLTLRGHSRPGRVGEGETAPVISDKGPRVNPWGMLTT